MKNEITYKIIKLNLIISIFLLVVGLCLSIYHNFNIDNFIVNLHSRYFATKIMDVGILFLILTPLFRILIELVFFIKEKNQTYVYICVTLLIIISISIIY